MKSKNGNNHPEIGIIGPNTLPSIDTSRQKMEFRPLSFSGVANAEKRITGLPSNGSASASPWNIWLGAIGNRLNAMDQRISTLMWKYGHFFLRISVSIIFIWFGALKPAGFSPAEELIQNTVSWFPGENFVTLLGWWEIAIGVCLFFRPTVRIAIILLLAHLPGTFLPLVILPDVCFTEFPFGLTMEGQYIIKNLLLVSSAILIGGTVRRQGDNESRL